MSNTYLSTENLPFCKGCGHHMVSASTEKAFQKLGTYAPLDVIMVSDIGCIGIIDKQYYTHTVHGLHGRSVALASGISLGLANPDKKIIVLLGDGGATIGLQHILEAAHRNINMTVIVHNNLLYGMTGGQPSGLTPCGFKTLIMPEGKPTTGFDLCKLVHSVGAPYVRRMLGIGDLSDAIAEALAVKGFSFIEMMEICTSYGIKFNPDRKMPDIVKEAGLELDIWRNPEKAVCVFEEKAGKASLLDSEKPIAVRYSSELKERFSLLLSGSAGEGVQLAAEFLAEAAIASGLSVTKKGSYPVTVGVGFSTSEIILSPKPIFYTGISTADAVVATSEEGLAKVKPMIEKMKKGVVYLDSTLAAPSTGASIINRDYRTPMGSRTASLLSVVHFLKQNPIIPLDAFLDVIKASKLGSKIDFEKLNSASE